jgi:hypothetical protein
VAAHAILEQRFLALFVGQELVTLQLGNLGPADHGGRKREVVGGVLVGGEIDPALRVGLVADRPHLQPIFAGRQVLGEEVPLIVGEHADRHLEPRMTGLHEGAPEGRAVRSGHGAGDGRGVREGRSEDRKTENSQGR